MLSPFSFTQYIFSFTSVLGKTHTINYHKKVDYGSMIIRKKMISPEYVDDVFSSLYLQLKEDFFKNVQNKTHQIITYDDWLKKYCANFNTYRETLLPLREYHPVLPEHLEQQTFVKELIEIGAIDMAYDGLAEIAELTQFYLIVELQLDDWYDDGKITLAQRNNFHKDAALI